MIFLTEDMMTLIGGISYVTLIQIEEPTIAPRKVIP